MNARQRRFVAEYIACRNASEAARRAGYSPVASAAAGSKQLKKPAVLAALRAAGIETGEGGALLCPLRRGADGLNPRQRGFVQEYVRSRNAKDAARRAGYATIHAAHTGSALLRFKPVIAALHKAGVKIRYGKHPEDQLRAQRLSYARKVLTPRQRSFIAHYLVHGKGRDAAIHAGYTQKNPSTAAWQVLQRPLVAAAIAEEREKLAARTRIDAARVVEEYAHIAFATIADLVDWGPKGVSLKPDAELTAARASAVLEITFGTGKEARRVRIKMPAKLKALDALARHFGLFDKRPPPARSPAEIAEAREKLRKRFLQLVDEGVKKKTG